MNDFLQFILLSLACWRICFLLIEDYGPKDIFIKFRYMIGVRYIVNGSEVTLPDMIILEKSNLNLEKHYLNNLSEMFSCYYCLSIYVAFILSVSYVNIDYLIPYTFSLSTFCIIFNHLHGIIRRRNEE